MNQLLNDRLQKKNVEQRPEDDVVLILCEGFLLLFAQVLIDVQSPHLVVHLLDAAIDLGSVLLNGANPEFVPEE